MPQVDSLENEQADIILSGVSIENYRSFKKFPDNGYLEIGRFTTIIGKNDVGKSNLLRAILLVLSREKPKVEDYHKRMYNNDIIVILRFSIKGEQNIIKKIIKEFDQLGIPVKNNEFYIGVRYKYNEKTGRINDEWFTYHQKNQKNINKTNLNKIREIYLPHPLYISSFSNPGDEVSLKQGSLLSELISPLIEESEIQLDSERQAIKVKGLLKQQIENTINKISEKLTSNLKQVWEDIEEVQLVVSNVKLSRALSIDVRLKDKYINDISLFKRGSGIQREFIVELLRVYRDLKIGKGYILMIEEPEIFLHAGAQKRFFSILKDISQQGQVIITTHSSIFIDKYNLKYTYLLKKRNGATVLAWNENDREKMSEIIEELGISPSDVFLANGVIIVEGITDKIVLEIFAKSILDRWNEYNIAIIYVGGKSNIKHYQENPNILKILNNNIAIILDSDIKSLEEELSQDLKYFKDIMEKEGIPVFFWTKEGKYVRELENLFELKFINERIKEILMKARKNCSNYEIKENEINLYVDDVYKKYSEKLKKCGLKPEDKTSFCRAVAEKMARNSSVPSDVKKLLESILYKFNLR